MQGSEPIGDAPVVGRCSARAALAGNPSDGYGGAVVSVPVASVAAHVEAAPSDRFEIDPSPTADDTFSDLDELCERVDRYGYGGTRQLLVATLRSLRRHVDAKIDPVRLTVSTTIPRSVGLAGSSAIVIAAMRALTSRHADSDWSQALRSDPALMAAVALDAETTELGITAGLQDRAVQSHDTPMLMEFDSVRPIGTGSLLSGTYSVLPRPPGIVLVAAIDATASPSGVAHRSLRDDFDADVGGVRRLMGEIAEHARSAAAAIERGDVETLGSDMDSTLELRQQMMVLDPRHLAMAEAARSHGAHANWSGSGGAVTVLAPNEAVAAITRSALVDELGCTIVDV
ncbi:mevalonate kinase family protein [Ilumatobacter coccineus]|uniref:GHMP kinase N-terminal domain-containing protein n=1 Tax=Ilumatobacter coccineus (strain NBRC 103263 / KCTC 29153 / YM16-304) TaxID=1313172 RepID=A0A6C7E9B5_ILUCY|nr:hypothetical protein [Ilumatobacter coccineus]BAN02612.1 hypothetical protein YM304_22980 [Ilumatobacter coccineus YM16-304]